MASQPAFEVSNPTSNEVHLLARGLLRLRQERQRHFSIDVTGPAWDLMLAMFDADGDDLHLSVGDLAVRAHVPRTTTIRWLREMERHGIVVLLPDRRDRRLVRVRVTHAGRETMVGLLSAARVQAL